ncbi:DUF2975 domain-containing protein [Kitasatospora sp. NPDC047058]|uniref:DUF2975 domain-containing protein n=1 Tax=Kitasatospora sp. NPDC047058 TaxID=3155620 RepID=UPI0033FFB3EA
MNNTSWSTRVTDHILELALGLALLTVGLVRILLPGLGIVTPFGPANTREVLLDSAARLPGDVTTGAVTLRGSGHAELAFTDPGLGQRLLLVLPELANGLLVVAILFILLRMARTFRDGDFFVPQNTRHITLVALVLLLTGTLVPLLEMTTTNLLARGLPMADAIAPAHGFAVQPVFLALLAGAAAAAFRAGTRLRADTEGLV